jgi:hypothetical protein
MNRKTQKPQHGKPELTRSEFIQAYLNKAQRAFDAGNKNAVLRAIQWAILQNVAVPPWAANHFNEAVEAWFEMKYRSFDEALGLSKVPEGTKIKAQRKKLDIAVGVWCRVMERHDGGRGEPIVNDLFEEVGKEFRIGRTTAAKYYSWALKLDDLTRTKLLVRYLQTRE